MADGWHRLDERTWDGPVVAALVHAERPRASGDPRPVVIECRALIDTGATHTIIDQARVAELLGLQQLDRRRLALAGAQRAEVPVHDVPVTFPDFPLPTRRVRVAAMTLPGPITMLVGMDLLQGTRLAFEFGPQGRWLRWEPLAP